ncbi:MAG: GTPase Era [Clostridia bacterium]|nr:GTPase Era [Clostridia bacterium]
MSFLSGFIAIVGRPNAGKSTLLNKLTGEKIAIISSKPQTTRNKILGILTEDDYQVVFVDTPGIHRAKNRLGEYMNKMVTSAIDEVDAALLIADATREIGTPEELLIKELKDKKIPTVLVINKTDAVAKETLLPLIEQFTSMHSFESVLLISAKQGDGIAEVMEEIKKYLPEGPMYYPDDMITDKTEREIAAEIVREKLLRLLDKEIPHGTAVETASMKEDDNIIRIEVNIYCEKSTHKAIIIGKNGAMLKRIGSYAREDMEKFFGTKVFLDLWVKVKENWRDSNFNISNFGFKDDMGE